MDVIRKMSPVGAPKKIARNDHKKLQLLTVLQLPKCLALAHDA